MIDDHSIETPTMVSIAAGVTLLASVFTLTSAASLLMHQGSISASFAALLFAGAFECMSAIRFYRGRKMADAMLLLSAVANLVVAFGVVIIYFMGGALLAGALITGLLHMPALALVGFSIPPWRRMYRARVASGLDLSF